MPDTSIVYPPIPFIDKGHVRAFMRTDSADSHAYMGTVFEVCEDVPADGLIPEHAEEVATIFLKWDGCSHVGFRSPEMGKNWVHVCGAEDMERTLRMLRWMWQEARARIPQYDPSVGGELAL